VDARAKELGFCDRIANTPAEAVKDAELVLIAVPVGATADAVKSVAPHLRKGAIITEVGSASGAIALKNGVVLRFAQMTSGGGDDGTGLWMYIGLPDVTAGDTFERTPATSGAGRGNTFLTGQFRTLPGRVQAEAIIARSTHRHGFQHRLMTLSGYSEVRWECTAPCSATSGQRGDLRRPSRSGLPARGAWRRLRDASPARRMRVDQRGQPRSIVGGHC
jgi:hypothetical protein